jgi:VanZ family protein
MLILFAVFAFLLFAGSLFPWTFRPGPDLVRAAWHVAASWRESCAVSTPQDILINVVIYTPIGFTAYLWRGWRSPLARWSGPVLAGLLLSFAIETLQHYITFRAPGLVDVLCNASGAFCGLVLAAVFRTVLESRHIEWRRRRSIHLSSAMLLLAIWIAATAWPVQADPAESGLRGGAGAHPGQWSPLDMLAGGLPLLLAGCQFSAMTGPRTARWWLAAVLPALCSLILLTPGQELTLSHFHGAAAAVLLFWLLPERHRHASSWLTACWLIWIVLECLRPFAFGANPNRFDLVPFRSMIHSPWMPGVGALLRTTWLYGAAYWLLAISRLSRRAALGVTALTALALETAECWLPGRSPGLTDPAIALLAASLLSLVDHRFAPAGYEPAGDCRR